MDFKNLTETVSLGLLDQTVNMFVLGSFFFCKQVFPASKIGLFEHGSQKIDWTYELNVILDQAVNRFCLQACFFLKLVSLFFQHWIVRKLISTILINKSELVFVVIKLWKCFIIAFPK